MILCIGPTPAAQRVMLFRNLVLDNVNRALTTLDGAAGKSVNVAKVLKTLGERPVATGFLGGPRGEALRTILQEKKIDMDFVKVTAPTRQCVTVIDQSQGTQTELVEESAAVAECDYATLESVVRNRIKQCRAVIISGTLTPGAPQDFYFRCTQMGNEAGALSVVDAQGTALIEALKARPGVVKPNRMELQATIKRKLSDEPSLMAAVRELHEQGAQQIIITAGKEPALAFDGRCFWRIRSPRIAAVNPIGSGDAFTAALTWRLLRGEDLGQAGRWASAAGAANALTALAGEVNREDLERLVKEVTVEEVK